MTSIDDLHRDVEGVSNNIFSNLSTAERLQAFAKQAAKRNDDRIEQLIDTAPKHTYTATDLDYIDGVRTVSLVSLLAKHELQRCFDAVETHEAARDRYMALLLLNASLSHQSSDEFDFGEFGDLNSPHHANAEYAYGEKYSPNVARLATAYAELWDDVPADLLIDESDRDIKQFPNLAAAGLLAYRDDLSGEAFADLSDDHVSSEVYLSELRLMLSLANLYTRFHGWRQYAEQHLDMCLDDFLRVSINTDDDDDVFSAHTTWSSDVSEQLCESTLSLSHDYIEAIPTVFAELNDDAESASDEPPLDDRAEAYAEALGDAIDLP